MLNKQKKNFFFVLCIIIDRGDRTNTHKQNIQLMPVDWGREREIIGWMKLHQAIHTISLTNTNGVGFDSDVEAEDETTP